MPLEPSETTEAPRLAEKNPRLVMFEFHQNDPKKDTGMRLVKRGSAKALKPHVPFQGILLSAEGKAYLSGGDREIVAKSGIGAINCSWNRLDEIPKRMKVPPHHYRLLPMTLVAANPINFGKRGKLCTAEALCAAAYITGYREFAEDTLNASFGWGEEFFELNRDVLELYAGCNNSEEVEEAERKFLRDLEEEAAHRQARMMPSSDSSSDEEDYEEEETRQVDACGNYIEK
ncbi:ribosome bioproteinsis protein tsr3 [Perkinsus olseni]|uniref:Ribosome bioproteinsis protein tsr3 n=1 Tax=Perkinsus olseni TaxID=32597 RepID=A0A7J6LXX9_PEROL|nr:ribosome bioproteinsis protein tsr3 [Perkinsus olseni]